MSISSYQLGNTHLSPWGSMPRCKAGYFCRPIQVQNMDETFSRRYRLYTSITVTTLSFCTATIDYQLQNACKLFPVVTVTDLKEGLYFPEALTTRARHSPLIGAMASLCCVSIDRRVQGN